MNSNLTNESSIIVNNENDKSNGELPDLRIANIVSMFEVGCNLNLRELALKSVNAEYNPKRLNAVIMRQKSPKTVALIFYTGKCICAGAKTEEDSKKAAKECAR